MSNRRKQRLEENTKNNADMEMTPMIDVTFLLLIFFMCTIKFKTLEGKLSAYLPKDKGVNPVPQDEPPEPPIEVKLNVRKEGTKLGPRGKEVYNPNNSKHSRFTFASDREITIRVEAKEYATVDLAFERLVVLHADEFQRERGVKIDARDGIVYDDVVRLLDAVIKAGFTAVEFEGYYEPE